jgi:lipoprotein-anchoring transpeptidase ErfK/SrfK
VYSGAGSILAFTDLMNRIAWTLIVVLAAVGCQQETVTQTTAPAPDTAAEARGRVEYAVPIGQRPTREQLEKERFDAAWRRLQSFQEQQAAQARQAQAAAGEVNIKFAQVPKLTETLQGLNAAALDTLPVQVPIKGDVSGPSVLRAQVFLNRVNYSPGIIDGRWGKNSEIAVYWFQRHQGLQATGEIDEATFRALAGAAQGQALVQHTLTADDVKGPFKTIPEDVYDQEKLDCLCYESVGEKLSERFHTTIEFLELLNPGTDIRGLTEGQQIFVPNVRPPAQGTATQVARVVVSVQGNYLHALDGTGKVVMHAPTTVGSEYDPSPTEEAKIVNVTFDPWFHYQPTLFHEVPDDEPEAHLPPGPNSPVGVVWIALSKKHFGIHGTSDPDSIGYASSHGCIRLANWDAAELGRMVKKDVVVDFVDTRGEG